MKVLVYERDIDGWGNMSWTRLGCGTLLATTESSFQVKIGWTKKWYSRSWFMYQEIKGVEKNES
jgi:hypothetical protein